jgi:hypothetical protein
MEIYCCLPAPQANQLPGRGLHSRRRPEGFCSLSQVPRSPTSANMGHPQIENEYSFPRYTRREKWATRPK